jgi:very-short-patch-repair endonuclease
MKTIPFENSFASHPKAKFWSTERNNGLKPEDFALNSHKKCWFDCECGHPFEICIKNINLLNRWCSYCSNKKLCGSCDICNNKSFASHYRVNNWSDKNNIEPKMVFKTSHKEYLFNCECGHEFKSSPKTITYNNSWCPYCSNPPKKLCENIQSCLSCQNKTFASVERSKNWSTKNKKKPIEVFKSTAEIFIFDCDNCDTEFKSKLCHITDGSWCPNCRYKTEEKLTKTLQQIYPNIKIQAKYHWCKNIKHLPFDFVLEEQKIIIECDGEQHWKQVAKWKTPEHNRNRDLYKIKCANENGYSVIRIVQEDVFKDKYDWLTELQQYIVNICQQNRVQNIYMCKNNEYKDFEISI